MTSTPLFTYKTDHIDTMLWQFCMGLLQLGNAKKLFNAEDVELLNAMALQRVQHLYKMFNNLTPSFVCFFESDGSSLRLDKYPGARYDINAANEVFINNS